MENSITIVAEDYATRYYLDDVKVIKKSGEKQDFNVDKALSAIKKSAYRALATLSDEDKEQFCKSLCEKAKQTALKEIPIAVMHNMVEMTLDEINPQIAKSYRDYRNYKQDFVHMMDEVYKKSQSIMYLGDKENANTDSALVSTRRSLVYNQVNKELYQKFFLTADELVAIRDGYIYIHDMSARRDTMNCCLFDVAKVLSGGFEMGNIWYNEPNSLDVAFDVIGDIVLSAASQQYGGFTLPEIDKLLAPYAKKTYDKYYAEYLEITETECHEKADAYAMKKTENEMKQGFQGWEYKFNTVASSRGDYPFITVTFGLGKSKFEKMASITCLKTRMDGQGKKGHKKVVLFPKLVFLYDENLHGKGKELEDVFEAGVACSMKSMYPDWLSMTGEGYIASMYKQYGKVISPMGCRAFLSPWYERGGFEPEDENDVPVFVGRFNMGAISLHLPMILQKARTENKPFFEVLDFYLEMIRSLHKRTVAYLGEMKASTNPLGFCQGGFLGGYLNPSDKIKPLLKSATASFGITAFNEFQMLYNNKSLVEDGNFALTTLKYINDKIKEFKEEDGILYAIYGR